MITHIDLFNRLALTNIAALWKIEDAVEKDLDAAYAEYQEAIAAWEKASEKLNADNSGGYDYEYDCIFLEMQRKYVAYLEKHMAYCAFHGYYRNKI